MMTCRELAEFLMRYLDEELPGAQRNEFDAHMDECPPCRVYLEQYRQTVRACKAAFQEPDAPVPEEVPPRLVEAVLAARRKGG
jgi:anti-sigma factor RsiW